MNAVGLHRMGRSITRSMVPLLCLLAAPAHAFDAPAVGPVAGPAYVPEISTTTLPRFDNVDGAGRTSRIDMAFLPDRRSGMGLVMGLSSVEGNWPPGSAFAGAQNFDLGLRWRYTLDNNYRIDVTAWRRVTPDAMTLIQARQPSYGARVEMQMGSLPRSGLVAERGFVGIQLESGARIALRRSSGKPMLYYRTKF